MPPQGDEFQQVEWPLVQDLEKLGWEILDGDVEIPGLTDRRASFRDVLLKDRLAKTLVLRIVRPADATRATDDRNAGRSAAAEE